MTRTRTRTYHDPILPTGGCHTHAAHSKFPTRGCLYIWRATDRAKHPIHRPDRRRRRTKQTQIEDGSADTEHGRQDDRALAGCCCLQLAALLLVALGSRSNRCQLRHDRQRPPVPGQGGGAVQVPQHHGRPALPPGHLRPRGAPWLGPRRRPRHPQRAPRSARHRRLLRRVLGPVLRAALRRLRALPLHQRRQRGHPGGVRRAGPTRHAEPRGRAPGGRAQQRAGHDRRGDIRAGVLVPAVAGRVLRGVAAGGRADPLLPQVEGHAAAGERVPVLRLLGRPLVGAARLRAAVVVGCRRRDGQRGGVRQHVRRHPRRGVRGGGEGGRWGEPRAGGVGDRVAVGRRRVWRQRGERGGVRQQPGPARRAWHAEAAREGRGDVHLRHLQREPEARGRGAELWALPAGHERGLPRRLLGGFFLDDAGPAGPAAAWTICIAIVL